MAETKQIRAIKGVRDILPPASGAWSRVERAAREVFATFAYGEIRLPIFEQAELFIRSIGVETDVVQKETYTFSDAPVQITKEGSLLEPPAEYELITLRPEATASVCRGYIEHGMQTLPGDVKLYYIGPMFRRERPQKGRYRQFYQIGAEVLGQSDAPGIDAELIEMLFAFFGRIGLEGLTLDLNSIGCKECRPKYVELLRAALRNVSSKLGADSQRRIETNPQRVLDSKLPEEQAIIEGLPRISEHLCEDCKEHFAEVRRQLDLRGIAYKLNWRLVRGLDYYMRTTFEITAPGLGSQNAVCGGGRYDGLVELLGGPPTKGIGFAIGEDRVMLSLEAAGKMATEPTVDAFIVWMGAATQPAAIKLAQKLRGAGIRVEVPPEETKFKKALGLADKLGARYAILIGENEVAAGKFTLKRLADAVQTSLTEAELVAELSKN
ncbi:MAG TPA: histidine--tRNA ligase [Candidatus Acidoferrales bacterium]|nr:histidine--tRNA ligase [Candidatus Acidoferrales bacterium]